VPDMTSGGDPVWSASGITLSLDADANTLIRTEGLDSEVIAENVMQVNFTSHATNPSLYFDEVRVVLELEKTSSMGETYNRVFPSTINLRN